MPILTPIKKLQLITKSLNFCNYPKVVQATIDHGFRDDIAAVFADPHLVTEDARQFRYDAVVRKWLTVITPIMTQMSECKPSTAKCSIPYSSPTIFAPECENWLTVMNVNMKIIIDEERKINALSQGLIA